MEAPATCKIYLTFNHNRNRFVLCSNSLTGRFRPHSRPCRSACYRQITWGHRRRDRVIPTMNSFVIAFVEYDYAKLGGGGIAGTLGKPSPRVE